MNSRIIKNDQRKESDNGLVKSLKTLTVCLIAVLFLASCASNNSRDVAQEKANEESKVQDTTQTPYRSFGKRLDVYDNY